MHVHIRHHLRQIPHRGARHPCLHQRLKQRLLGMAPGEPRDDLIHRIHRRHAQLEAAKARIIQQLRSPHHPHQRPPMRIAHADDGNPAIRRRVDIVRRLGEPTMTVAGARRRRLSSPLAAPLHAKAGAERGIDRILHRHLHPPGHAMTLPLEQGGGDGAIQMRAGEEVAQSRPRLHRRTIRKARGAHHARHRLNGKVHRRIGPIRPVRPEARAGGIDQLRIARLEHGAADAQPVHRAGGEILHQDICLIHQPQQRLSPRLGLEIKHDALLATVEHGERQRRPTHHAAPSQRLTPRRLHLDHRGAGRGQHEGGVRAVVDLAEIDHHDPGKRQGRAHAPRAPRRNADQAWTGHISWSSP